MTRNYFFNLAEDSLEATFLKIKDKGDMIVVTSDMLDTVMGLPKIHTTFHESDLEKGYPLSIVHTRKDTTREKILQVKADGSVHGTMIDLSDINWSSARKFQRKSGDNVIRFDRPFVSGVLTMYFMILSNSSKINSFKDAIQANEILALVPTDDGAVSTGADHTLCGSFPRINGKGRIDWAILSIEGKNMEIRKTEGKEVKVAGFAAFAPGKEKIVE